VVPLQKRLANVGISSSSAQHLIQDALADSGWRSIASLDAAVRMVEAIVRAKGLSRGAQAARVVRASFDRARSESSGPLHLIPSMYWSVEQAAYGKAEAEYLTLKGAVLVRVR